METEDQNQAEAEAMADAIRSACEEPTDETADVLPMENPAAELAAEKDNLLRLRAEMENLRSRTAREVNEARRYAALPFARDLLPALDNIGRAIESADQGEQGQSLLEGFRLVQQQLLSLLEQHHCLPIEALGESFDPHCHEAILQQPSDQHPADTVSMVTETGYQMHDRVVRPAKVIVSSGPATT